jgi:type II secretory pathway pseudopilin PulG
MGSRRLSPLVAIAIFALMLAALACTCGPLSRVVGTARQISETEATLSAAQEMIDSALGEFGPTIEAQMTEFGPTLIAGATQYGPELQTLEAGAADAAATAAAMQREGAGGVPNTLDGGDGLATTGGGTISVGGSVQGTLDSLFEAHNWVFEGQAGQTVTIRADAVGETDPRVRLLDPGGSVIAEDDDGGGGLNALLTATLPMSGTYTIRVDIFVAGTYTLTLQ